METLRFTGAAAPLAAAGLVSVALGFWLLARGSLTAAPLLLLAGYVVLIPAAIALPDEP